MNSRPRRAKSLASVTLVGGALALAILAPAADAALPAQPAATACKTGDLAGCTAKCTANDADSCANLGWFTYKGIGTAVDKVKGKALLTQACTMKNQWACEKAKEAT